MTLSFKISVPAAELQGGGYAWSMSYTVWGGLAVSLAGGLVSGNVPPCSV
jgi:hypothetical protein